MSQSKMIPQISSLLLQNIYFQTIELIRFNLFDGANNNGISKVAHSRRICLQIMYFDSYLNYLFPYFTEEIVFNSLLCISHFHDTVASRYMICLLASHNECHNLNLLEHNLVNLLSVTASFCESCPSSGWLTEHNITRSANNNGLSVAENSGNLKTSGALDVHEKTIGALYKTLEFVRAGLSLRGRIQKIDGHFKLKLKIDGV